MKYRIDAKYVWYDDGNMLVLMYFIQGVPFTFDELPDEVQKDLDIINLADKEKRWSPEDVYRGYSYLMEEQCHPCLFELELENPECLPVD
jgi:hypothetical protein